MSSSARGTASVLVPATSANLGPGYDAMGLALEIYDEVSASIIDEGLRIHAHGEGAANVARDESHLIIRSLRTTLERLDATATGISLNCVNRIPHGRGLGSSAAAICAGVLLGRALVPDGEQRLDDAGVLALASEIEGHPDNVAACLLGGVTIAFLDAGYGRYRAVRVEPIAALLPVVFIPPFESSTEQARRLLPAEVPHADAAFNVARSALLVAALVSETGALFEATEDRLHQPYRASAMPGSAALVRGLREAGIAAVISGAGPTVLALTVGSEQAAAAADLAPMGWSVQRLAVSRSGARIVSS